MNNFNLRKFLAENKLTGNSRVLNEVAENFLDAVFSSLNDMMRAGEISGEEFDAAKSKLENNPASLTPFEKKKDVQAAAESLLKGVDEDQERDHQFYANQEGEEVIMQIAKTAINLMDEQPGTSPHIALQSVLEDYIEENGL